eukprot:SAG31_NODE_3963_length_3716_cov_3.038430_6_plen_188_part_00
MRVHPCTPVLPYLLRGGLFTRVVHVLPYYDVHVDSNQTISDRYRSLPGAGCTAVWIKVDLFLLKKNVLLLVGGLRRRHSLTSRPWMSCSARSVSRHPSPPLEVREGQRGALRLRRLASGLALVVVRTPRVPRARVLRLLHLHLPRRRRRARLVPLNRMRVEIVVPQAPHHRFLHRNAFDWNETSMRV